MNLLSNSEKGRSRNHRFFILSSEVFTVRCSWQLTRCAFRQDYHYLKYYARAHAYVPSYTILHLTFKCHHSLLASKSEKFAPLLAATKIVFHIAEESSMHIAYCAQWGITLEELESTPESPTTTAYGAFLIDTGLKGANCHTEM